MHKAHSQNELCANLEGQVMKCSAGRTGRARTRGGGGRGGTLAAAMSGLGTDGLIKSSVHA